jgi:hypothetical protein
MSKNLVELMDEKVNKYGLFGLERALFLDGAKCMLSVVKEHIGDIAMPCDCKVNYYQKCPKCKGSGVIARTEGGGK